MIAKRFHNWMYECPSCKITERDYKLPAPKTCNFCGNKIKIHFFKSDKNETPLITVQGANYPTPKKGNK